MADLSKYTNHTPLNEIGATACDETYGDQGNEDCPSRQECRRYKNGRGRDVASLSAQVSGEGVLAQDAVDDWLKAVESIDSIPVKVILEFPAKTVTWTGSMHVSDFTIQGELGNRVTVNATLNSDGELTRTTTPVTP